MKYVLILLLLLATPVYAQVCNEDLMHKNAHDIAYYDQTEQKWRVMELDEDLYKALMARIIARQQMKDIDKIIIDYVEAYEMGTNR